MSALSRLALVAANPELDADLAVKIVREMRDIAQALPKDKADPYANLPVFHIHFGSAGQLTGTAEPAVLEMVEEVAGEALPPVPLTCLPAFDILTAEPSPFMSASAHINKDVLLPIDAEAAPRKKRGRPRKELSPLAPTPPESLPPLPPGDTSEMDYLDAL